MSERLALGHSRHSPRASKWRLLPIAVVSGANLTSGLLCASLVVSAPSASSRYNASGWLAHQRPLLHVAVL